uniref:Pyrroline-5-carboxylate reductase 3 n=1 Tax=Astyanax mexicanus TaxID=7994 RepID=A0A8B9HNT8_ASTMX
MENLSQLKIGFIGAGNMAFAISQGILKSGDIPPSSVIVSAPSKNNFARFQAMGVAVTHSNEEVVDFSCLVFLAVKPHLIPTVINGISEHITPQHIIVSMAAGITLATLEELLPGGSRVMRLMPNLPCMLQEGALLLACGTGASQEVGALLKTLLCSCGLVEVGPETWIDAHTGLSGSGVAFGAGRLLRDGGKHPAQLRAEVCTPGGTTIHGLHALEKGGLRAATMGAVEAATLRASQLGRK